ncbi:hypothetical protein GCM10022291_11370 [Postechiella marina]|uniref:Uncharacterized protein n=1 Tax=Postechiella marina TaxID=943941 RepID=A0ABP8C5M9_9FLAO
MILKIKLFICIFFISISVFSQQSQINSDSILKRIERFRTFFYKQQRFGEALALSEDLLKIAEQEKSDTLIARANNDLGLSFSALKDKNKAIVYYKKALAIYKKLNLLNEVGNVSNNIGIAYAEINDFENAKVYYFEALDYFETEDDKAHVYHDLGYDYGRNGYYKNSIEYVNKALPFILKNKEVITEGYSYQALFYAYYNLKNKDSADFYFYKGINHAKAIDNLDIIYLLYEDRFDQLKKENNAKEGFKVIDSVFKYKNLLKEREALNIYKEVEAKLHIKDTNNKLKIIKKEKRAQQLLNVTLVSLLTILLVLGLLLYRKNNQLIAVIQNLNSANQIAKQSLLEKELLEQQLENIQDDIITDIQDNFGNRLSGISNSYEIFLSLFKTEDTSSEKLEVFKSNLEHSLKNLQEDIKDFIWSNKSKNNSLVLTLNKLEMYVYNLANENSDVSINIKSNLAKDEYKLPKYWNRQLFLILRETIENALKYSKPTYVTIDFSIDKNNKLTIITADDGNEFKSEALLNSVYLFNVKRRAQTMGSVVTMEPKGDNNVINRVIIEGKIPSV